MPFEKITSVRNPKIKEAVRLRDRKAREESGLTIVEGQREILRALQAGVLFKELFFCCARQEIIDKFLKLRLPVFETTKEVFAKMAYGDREEGVLAVCQTPTSLPLKDFPKDPNPLYVVVERVEKPGNLGAILRSCDGAGVGGVMVCHTETDLYNPNVIRASLGTIFSVKAAVCSNEDVLAFLKARGVRACAAAPQAKKIYTRVDLKGALALVVGSEEKGLSDFWIHHADEQISIPMLGQSDSLNVSVSTAILLYEARRQRG